MKKKIISEVLWLAAIFIAAFLLSAFASTGNALDINIHDTYIIDKSGGYNLPLPYFVFAYLIIIGFAIYFIRAVYFEFKKVQIDVILSIFTVIFLYFLNGIILMFNPLVIDRMPSSPEAVKGLFYGGSYSHTAILLHQVLMIFLMMVLLLTTFMIGRTSVAGRSSS